MLRRYGAFAGGRQAAGAADRGPAAAAPATAATFDMSDLGSFGGLGDLFWSIFGTARRAEEGRGRTRSRPCVTIPFRVAALGGKVPIMLPMPEVCPTCGGNGARAGRDDLDLPRVQGPRHRLVRPGQLCGEPALPGVSRQRQGALASAAPRARASGRCGSRNGS